MKRLCKGFAPIAFAVGIGVAGGAMGNPTGPVVVSGQVTFPTNGSLIAVTNRPGAIINWQQGFSIAPNEVARFVQQSPSATALNRVTGASPAVILGNLQSNGRVFMLNPNGIGANTGVASGVIDPGKTVELSDPRAPGLVVEIKAPANRALNVQQLVDSIGKRDVSSALTMGNTTRAATTAVRDAAGNIVLRAAE